MKVKNVALGLVSYIPGAYRVLAKGTRGTDTARYCYSVWLRHLVMARRNGMRRMPDTAAELGPGDSLGIGLSALISGVERYFALDVVPYANAERNLEIFGELVALFTAREDIPGENEFPDAKPYLESYEFPADILDDNALTAALDNERIKKIKNAIVDNEIEDSCVRYIVPWFDAGNLRRESVDLVFSQAVLEHVDDLPGAYGALYAWLKPGGFMSHQIDFKSHGMADGWNGHWEYSDFAWKLVRGARPYLINREPHSTHVRLMKEAGFEVVCDRRVQTPSSISRSRLAPRFQNLSDDDLAISGAFIQAIKPLSP